MKVIPDTRNDVPARYPRLTRLSMALPYRVGRDFRRYEKRRRPRRGPTPLEGSGSVLGDLDPALAHRVDDGLGAVVDRQLAQDRRHVVLHRLLADGERVGHLLVCHALGDVVEDLDLTR